MKILDKYILKKFLSTFLLILCTIVIIILLIDFTEKSYFFNKHNLGKKELFDYYCSFLPFMTNLLTPIIVFITTVWVTTVLSQRTEIIAILSSGISFARFALPYLIAAMLITISNFYLTGWLLADANKHRVAFESKYIEGISQFSNNNGKHLHIKLDPSTYLYIQDYYAYNSTGYHVMLDKLNKNALVERLSAQKIRFSADKKWIFTDWQRRAISIKGESIEVGTRLELPLDIDPEDFSINPKLRETLTITELGKHIEKLRNKGSDNVYIFMAERHIRYMSPFAVLILTCLGLVVSAYKSRGGIGSQITLGFILAFGYIIFFFSAKIVSETQGTNLVLNIWLPNMIFSLLSTIFYRLAPK